MWMPEVGVISSEEVFALQMVRPTFGLFNHIRKKKASCRSKQKPGWSLAGNRRQQEASALHVTDNTKAGKTQSQYREGRCPGARRYCSPLEVSALMFHINKKNVLVCSCCTHTAGNSEREISPEVDLHLLDCLAGGFFLFQPSNSAAVSTSTIVCQAQLVLTGAVAFNMNPNIIQEVTSWWISG